MRVSMRELQRRLDRLEALAAKRKPPDFWTIRVDFVDGTQRVMSAKELLDFFKADAKNTDAVKDYSLKHVSGNLRELDRSLEIDRLFAEDHFVPGLTEEEFYQSISEEEVLGVKV